VITHGLRIYERSVEGPSGPSQPPSDECHEAQVLAAFEEGDARAARCHKGHLVLKAAHGEGLDELHDGLLALHSGHELVVGPVLGVELTASHHADSGGTTKNLGQLHRPKASDAGGRETPIIPPRP
jgi:hypothetical protein